MGTATLRTTEGVEYVIPCHDDTTLLMAAEEAGHLLVAGCRHGMCGMCRARLASGRMRLGAHAPTALSDADEADGGTLLCCGFPDGNVTIELPYDSARVRQGTIPLRRATVTSIERLPGDIVRLRVRVMPDEAQGTGLVFEAGQYAELTPPDSSSSRAFSFASASSAQGEAEFLIKVGSQGFFGDYLTGRADVGDVVALRGPQGDFTLHESGRPRWMVCGGSGLAPMLAMLRQMAERGDTTEALLVLGVSTPDEVFATDELAQLQAALPTLRVIVPVWRPDASWTGPVGSAAEVLDAELATLAPDAERPDLYLCGPDGFLDAARAAANAHGVPAGQVYVDGWAAPAPAPHH